MDADDVKLLTLCHLMRYGKIIKIEGVKIHSIFLSPIFLSQSFHYPCTSSAA